MRTLIVEDEPRLRETLRRGLLEEGFAVDDVGTMRDADVAMGVTPYALVVLDLGLPDGDGLGLLATWRRRGNRVPVLVLTARDAIPARIKGLDAGADDYLVKPFAFTEFLARCRALSRRGPSEVLPVLRVGDVSVDLTARSGSACDRPLDLRAKEFAILSRMARHPERIYPKVDLFEACWDEREETVSNVVEVHVAALRRKLRDAGSNVSIRALRNLGYRLYVKT